MLFLLSAFLIIAITILRAQAGVDFVNPNLGGGFMLDNGEAKPDYINLRYLR